MLICCAGHVLDCLIMHNKSYTLYIYVLHIIEGYVVQNLICMCYVGRDEKCDTYSNYNHKYFCYIPPLPHTVADFEVTSASPTSPCPRSKRLLRLPLRLPVRIASSPRMRSPRPTRAAPSSSAWATPGTTTTSPSRSRRCWTGRWEGREISQLWSCQLF